MDDSHSNADHAIDGAPRVFVGVVEIAGLFGRLTSGFRELGLDAVFIDLGKNAFGYPTGGSPTLIVRMTRRAAIRRASTPRRLLPLKLFWFAAEAICRGLLLAWAVVRYDVFIFSYGQSLLDWPSLPLLDLPLLKALGKRIVVVFNGSDSRPPFIDGAIMAPDQARTTWDCIVLTRQTMRRVQRAERYASACVVHGQHAHFFRKPFAQTLLVGLPAPVAQVQETPRRPGPIRVVHAPSHAQAKGSEIIARAVEQCRAEGLDLEYRELSGLPNDVVLGAIANCDFVIDQAYSDIPTPVFTIEAAAFAKPSIVGGYAWPDVRRVFPPEDVPPVELCHPDELAGSIRRLALDQTYRERLGLQAHEFVAERWKPAAVASRYLRLAKGTPVDWQGMPGDVRYLQGVGLSEDRSRELIRHVLEVGGRDALQLASAPELEQAFASYAGGSNQGDAPT